MKGMSLFMKINYKDEVFEVEKDTEIKDILKEQINNSKYTIMNLGDKLSIGIKEKSYIDYYKEYINKEKEIVEVKNTYSTNTQSINNTLFLIENTPKIRRELIDSDLLIITLGYNDLIYRISLEENINDKSLDRIINDIRIEYNQLINEIIKYYHKDIIVVGYYKSNSRNEYINKGIVKLNKILQQNKKIEYIDTYNLISNNPKYLKNQDSYYPNNRGYYEISKKIISKTLEII